MARHVNGDVFSCYGWTVCLWVLVCAFQYGYHISVLNQIQAVLTCKVSGSSSDVALLTNSHLLQTCIPMSDVAFSIVTSTFTVGGLAGSAVASLVMDRHGRRGASRICAAMLMAGTALMGLGNSIVSLAFGRLLVGVASGIGLCVGPVYLAEIAPAQRKDSIGVLTQLSIVVGIMVTQIFGFVFATPSQWRYVFLLSGALSAIQFLSGAAIAESPAWLVSKGRLDEREKLARRLWGPSVPHAISAATEDSESLLDYSETTRIDHPRTTISVPQLLASRELRSPLMIVSLAMFSQQVSGINAVLYYSNDILGRSLPDWAPYISLGIVFVNFIMSFPAIFLIERLGAMSLFALSSVGSLLSLMAVGFGLNSHLLTLSSVSIVAFVMSFSIGLGPVPFVIIPEVSPPHAISALSSVGLSLNWLANFAVGLTFLPLRNFLAGGDTSKEGRVFYVFVAVLFVSTYAFYREYRK